MDFEQVLELLIKDFEKDNIQYALIGGFAMGAFGILRATMDLDFLIDVHNLPSLEKIMQKYDYESIYKTENVSQYRSPLKMFGEIDFIHAFREISLSMLERAKKVSVFDGKYKLNVLQPEDIIGLKIQASINDESRMQKEYSDIEMIMDHFKGELDWDLISKYFSLFEKTSTFIELRNKYE